MSDLTNRRSYMLVTNTEIVLIPWPISTTKTKLELKFCFSNTLFRILLKKKKKKKKNLAKPQFLSPVPQKLNFYNNQVNTQISLLY